MLSRFSLAIALFVVAACGDGFLVSSRFDATLRMARARWENSGVDSYEMTLRRLCFCGFVEPVRVTVADGVVVSRIVLRTGDPLPTEYAPYYPDVPGLFAIIEHARATGADDLATEFDASYGFPAEIDIDWIENAVDDEVAYRTEGFAVRP